MRVLFLLVITIVLISCGASVTIDYDKETDFSQYQSYNFYPEIESGLSEFDDDRIEHIVDSLMTQRGIVRSDSPEFMVNYYAVEYLSHSRNSIGIGVGGGGGNVGVGVSGGIPIGGNVITQMLTIDLIDSAKDALVWQAKVEGERKEKSSPEQKEAYYFSVIQKALKAFPPKKK